MNYRMFKKYYMYEFRNLHKMCKILNDIINNKYDIIPADVTEDLLFYRNLSTFRIVFSPRKIFSKGRHYFNLTIKKFQIKYKIPLEMINLLYIVDDKNYLIDFILKNYKTDLAFDTIESYRY